MRRKIVSVRKGHHTRAVVAGYARKKKNQCTGRSDERKIWKEVQTTGGGKEGKLS